jgi:hypothetical protein
MVVFDNDNVSLCRRRSFKSCVTCRARRIISFIQS